MCTVREIADPFLSGPLWTGALPFALTARLCDLRPRFLVKGEMGRGYRFIARNGRILLASERSLAELAGKTVCLRVQTWHKSILPGETPVPYGLLLCVRECAVVERVYATCLAPDPKAPRPRGARGETMASATESSRPSFAAQLTIEVGGGHVLAFTLTAPAAAPQ